MPKVALYNMQGSNVGEIALNDDVFGIEPNEHVVYQAITAQRASMRSGTHDVKNRSEVRGGGRKPYKQKGTGNARQGSIRAPQWVGGGTVFGPTPRDYGYRIPKKVRQLAIRSVLSAKVKDNELIVIDTLVLDQPKTKEAVKALANLKIDSKAIFVSSVYDENLDRSTRNIPGVKYVIAHNLNTLDLVAHDRVIISKDAVAKVEEVLA